MSELFWTKRSIKDLRLITSKEAKRIVSKIELYCQQADPFIFAEPLRGILKGLFRFRVGDYRVIFQKDARGKVTIFLILSVRHRKDAYE